MISLKKSLDQIEYYDRLFQTALQAYLNGISSLQQLASPKLDPEAARWGKRIVALHEQLSSDPSPDNLDRTAKLLDQELHAFKQRLETALDAQRAEVQQILTTLAEAASALEHQNNSYAGEFRSFTRQLEAVSRLDSLSEIRRRLTIQVAQMKTSLERVSREHQESLEQLRRELQNFQGRLERAEQLASTDGLTGLANRRECERRLREWIQSGQTFCLMLMDLDQFKALNDRYGHHVGDQVLVTFAQNLRQQFRATDLVGRWGGDEFVAIMDCPLAQALQKSRQVIERAGGWYTVSSAGKSFRVLVRASAGLAEHRPDETLEQLYTRADEALYANKSLRVAT